MSRSILKVYGRTAAMPTACELISQIATKFVSNYNNSKIWIKQMHGRVKNSNFYIPNHGSAWPVPIRILKSWVLLGTGYREIFKNWVTLGTGTEEIWRSWVPLGTEYQLEIFLGTDCKDADPWSQHLLTDRLGYCWWDFVVFVELTVCSKVQFSLEDFCWISSIGRKRA